MTQLVLPRLNQVGANEWDDVESNDLAIRAVINGGLDNGNLSGAAAITDANLASPNNAAYRTLLTSVGVHGLDNLAGTYLLGSAGDAARTMYKSGQSQGFTGGYSPPDLIHFDDADYVVGSKTQKLRVRAQVAANATAPAITFTVGLYPLTVAGATDALAFTVGTVVTGSTVAIASPPASTITQDNSGDFAIPADGAHCLAVVTSAQIANNSAVTVAVQLQTRSV